MVGVLRDSGIEGLTNAGSLVINGPGILKHSKKFQQTPQPHKNMYKALLTIGLTACAISGARADYQSTVLADGPKAYYRLNDDTSRSLVNLNSGTLGAVGNGTNDLSGVFGGAVHPFPGAIAGDPDRAEFYDYTTRTEIPFNAVLNPANNKPFTVEAWLYPATDQANVGMGALCNRWTSNGNRQGWVMYQRASNTNNAGYAGNGLGWEFRMYDDLSTSTRLDVLSNVPFQLGKWQHVVVVYDPVLVTNAILSIYINGVKANQAVWAGTTPGYGPCTGDHATAPNGQPAMSIGGYNNANSGTAGFANPWFGGADEFAFYTNKLTDAQILAHYQNGTNANRGQSYDSLVKSANPAVYLRLDEIAPNSDIANNFGDLRSAAIATNSPDVKHPAAGSLQGRSDSGAASYHRRNGGATTDLPYQLSNNPDCSVPFTFETWVRPTSDNQNPGAAPVCNRYVKSGHRTGWAIFQRAPNASYSGVSGYSGVGWNFRMYDGLSTSGQDVTTGVPYTLNQWQHLVFTWEPYFQLGGGNGNNEYTGVLTAYFNGVPVATNTAANYASNVNPTEDGSMPSDFAVGAYNAASGLGGNPYEGDVDELAFYNAIVLTPAQILAHYQAATNPSYGTNYETLVYTAGLLSQTIPGAERTGLPTTYLRLNDPAYSPANNSGTAGFVANGSLVMTTNIQAGPQTPSYVGFDALNSSLPLDGVKQWASLGNPPALNISGQITLEAWIQPGTPGLPMERIVSHGPDTVTTYPAQGFPGAITNTSEVFLSVDGYGAAYSVGCAQYSAATGVTTTYEASAAASILDFGSSAWVHLVGTYDGAYWNLYTNGVLAAKQAAATGALAVNSGDWAIGSTGNGWADNFTGNIDEVAVYSKALSPAQVASHYLAGKLGSSAISIVPTTGGRVIITWPAGTTLQQSSTLNGSYTAVPGSPVSPLTVSAAGNKFYRWSMP